MSYHTDFEGVLKFSSELTIKGLKKLKNILGEDCRNHPGWNVNKVPYLNYIDLELTEDMDGLEHHVDGNTSDMTELVNIVIRQMRTEFPDFGLTGKFIANGEEREDVYEVYIGADGFAHTRDYKCIPAGEITCPHCQKLFNLDEIT